MLHAIRPVRLAVAGAAVAATAALVIPAIPAHATTHTAAARSAGGTQAVAGAPPILSLCLTIREVAFHQCLVI
jgi:hypothetical protein